MARLHYLYSHRPDEGEPEDAYCVLLNACDEVIQPWEVEGATFEAFGFIPEVLRCPSCQLLWLSQVKARQASKGVTADVITIEFSHDEPGPTCDACGHKGCPQCTEEEDEEEEVTEQPNRKE